MTANGADNLDGNVAGNFLTRQLVRDALRNRRSGSFARKRSDYRINLDPRLRSGASPRLSVRII